jgi:hypothetical protein
MGESVPSSQWIQKWRGAFGVFGGVLIFQLLLLIWFRTIYGIDPFIRLLDHEYFFVRHWLPLFQSLIWLYFTFTQSSVGLLILMSFVAAGACMMFYQWSAKIFDHSIAIIAVLLVVFNPVFAVISRAPYLEGLTILLVATTLYFFEERRWKLAWLSFLLACLTRTEPFLLIIVFAIRFWHIYEFRKSLKYTLAFSLPLLIGASIFLYVVKVPPSAFNPATHAIITNIRFSIVEITRQILMFAMDYTILFFVASLSGIIVLIYKRHHYSAYALVPVLFLVHGILNGTTCTCYFQRTMLLAYVFFAPYAAYAGLSLYRISYPKIKPVLAICGVTVLILMMIASISLIKNADAQATPWKDSGLWLQSTFGSTARILVLPLYDPTGLKWYSWRYIAPLYYSRLSIEKNFIIDQENKTADAIRDEIATGRFDGIIISDHNSEAVEAVKTLVQSKALREIGRFPEEFRVFKK